jgi:hypothetical protein
MEKIILISLLIYWILSGIITFISYKWDDYNYRKYYQEKCSLYELISEDFLNILLISMFWGWGILPMYLILRVIDCFRK